MSYQKLPKFKVMINGTPINVMADTGASVNILDEATFAKLRTKPKFERNKRENISIRLKQTATTRGQV